MSGQGSNIKTVGKAQGFAVRAAPPTHPTIHTRPHPYCLCLPNKSFWVYMNAGLRSLASLSPFHRMRVEFLLKTNSGYPKDTAKGATLFTLATPGNTLGYTLAIPPLRPRPSPPSPISALAHSRGRGPSHQPTC